MIIFFLIDNVVVYMLDDDNDVTTTVTPLKTAFNIVEMHVDDTEQFIDSLMNIDAGYTSKTAECICYEENGHDTTKYHDEMKRMMIAVKKYETFEVDINDDSEKQYAFTQVLRYIGKNTPS